MVTARHCIKKQRQRRKRMGKRKDRGRKEAGRHRYPLVTEIYMCFWVTHALEQIEFLLLTDFRV